MDEGLGVAGRHPAEVHGEGEVQLGFGQDRFAATVVEEGDDDVAFGCHEVASDARKVERSMKAAV